MSLREIKEPSRTVLRKYCHVECYDSQLLREAISPGQGFPYNDNLFKAQLREAIDMKLILTEEYEELTEEDFDSQDDLQAWLEELWSEVN